jgi:hypothetical protein
MHIPHIVKRFEAGLGEKLFQSLTFWAATEETAVRSWSGSGNQAFIDLPDLESKFQNPSFCIQESFLPDPGFLVRIQEFKFDSKSAKVFTRYSNYIIATLFCLFSP